MANFESLSAKRVVIISPDNQLVNELTPLLQLHLGASTVERVNGYPSPEMLASAAEGGASFLLFLDFISDSAQAAELLEKIGPAASQFQILALLGNNGADQIMGCLRLGAVDFLVQPFTGDQLEGALTKLSRVQLLPEVARNQGSRIVAVMPAKGACGATTIASNLALQAKKQGVKRVLLIDLDPLTGNLSFLLKVKSIYSFLDALHRASELDQDLWKAMVTEVGGVDVLLSPDIMPNGSHELRDPSPILDYARRHYDLLILDTSSVYGDWNLNVARMASEVLLVTTNELPALQAAQRALSYMDTNRVGRWKVRLIVNRYLIDVGLSRDVIGTALHTEVYETLPSDYEAVQKALMEGRSIPMSSPFGKSIANLAGKLTGFSGPPKPVPEAPPKKASSLSGLFSLFSKTKALR